MNGINKVITGEIEKVYFSIGDVADLFGIATSQIRFYDDYFNLKVKKNKIGNRHFTRENIAKLDKIIRLAEHCKLMTVKLILNNELSLREIN